MQRELMQKKLQRAFDALAETQNIEEIYGVGYQVGIAIASVKDVMEILEESEETEKPMKESLLSMTKHSSGLGYDPTQDRMLD